MQTIRPERAQPAAVFSQNWQSESDICVPSAAKTLPDACAAACAGTSHVEDGSEWECVCGAQGLKCKSGCVFGDAGGIGTSV